MQNCQGPKIHKGVPARVLAADDFPPDYVRRKCEEFLQHLVEYEQLVVRFWRRFWVKMPLADFCEGDGPQAPIRINRVWRRLEKIGTELVSVGEAWNMEEWLATEQVESLPYEMCGFFLEPDPNALWGHCLAHFVRWRRKAGAPFGFAGREHEDDPFTQVEVFGDVSRDVRCLLAAANERSLGPALSRPPLSDNAKAVLELIPFGSSNGITGKEIVDALWKAGRRMSQSNLTTHIMPKLERFYDVMSGPRGYYRP